MGHRIGIVTLLMAVGAGIVVGLPWMLADPAGSVPSLLRHGAWVVAVLVCGLMWLAVEYGRDRRRALRDRRRQLRKIDWGGS
ncbi:MAG: hypothetical protein Q7W02_27080 [Candidatus Rokubacteria bacterium]|nr:hypothetical protein [Candidatus Rokubacteria bacterium]